MGKMHVWLPELLVYGDVEQMVVLLMFGFLPPSTTMVSTSNLRAQTFDRIRVHQH